MPAIESRDVNLIGKSPDVLSKTDGPPTFFSCPECGGSLWELKEGGKIRFRCHTGHGFTAETLLTEQYNEFEHALWTAIRVLQERSSLHRELAGRMEPQGMDAMAKKYNEISVAERQQSEVLREFFRREFPGDQRPIQLHE
jgi:two-component system chemotaxis response regulator CheB